MNIHELEQKALWVRQKTAEMCHSAGSGHIAPVYSCAEILVALYYGGIMRYREGEPYWPGRDLFILSKGQACAGLYAILADIGYIQMKELETYGKDGSRLGGHADSCVPGVDFYTGSLGHGLGVAAGMAEAIKMKGEARRVFVLLGDGECQEGSVWEAAMYASAHGLDNLIAVVDWNQQQATDYTHDVFLPESINKILVRWTTFGWSTRPCNGHRINRLLSAFQLGIAKGGPYVIIAETVKGKGVPEIERNIVWHYRVPVTAEECGWFNEALGTKLEVRNN